MDPASDVTTDSKALAGSKCSASASPRPCGCSSYNKYSWWSVTSYVRCSALGYDVLPDGRSATLWEYDRQIVHDSNADANTFDTFNLWCIN